MKIRIAGISPESVVDGPGIRYVVFAQGCKHGCKGCHNPETHSFKGGYEVDADEIIKDIKSLKYFDGVTFSGGDPFFQAEGFSYISEKLQKDGIHVMAYTGFIYENILKDVKMTKLLKSIDVLVDGPFIIDKKVFNLPFRGSSNQRVIDIKSSISNGDTIVLG